MKKQKKITPEKVTMYWSRAPGKFVDKMTGEVAQLAVPALKLKGPQFTGTVREWYEMLPEVCIDVMNSLKDMKGSQELGKPGKKQIEHPKAKLITGPDVMTIIEMGSLFKMNYMLDENGKPKSVTAVEGRASEPHGRLSGRFDVYKDMYLKRNVITIEHEGLVGKIVVLDMNILD